MAKYLIGILIGLVAIPSATEAAKFRAGQIVYNFTMIQRYTIQGIAVCKGSQRGQCYSVMGKQGSESFPVSEMDSSSVSEEDFAKLKIPFEPGSLVFNHVHQQLHLYDEVTVRPCGNPRRTELPWPCARDTISGQDVLVSMFYDFVAKRMIDEHIEFLSADNYHTLLGTTSFGATTENPAGVWQVGDANRKLLCFLVLFPDGTFVSNGGVARAPYVRGRFQFMNGGVAFSQIEGWVETKGKRDGRFVISPPVVLSILEMDESKMQFLAGNDSGAQYIFAAYHPNGR